MGIEQYRLDGVKRHQFIEDVFHSLEGAGEEVRTYSMSVDATPILNELAERRGGTPNSVKLRLRIKQIGTMPFSVYVLDQYDRWFTINVPSNDTDDVTFEVIGGN